MQKGRSKRRKAVIILWASTMAALLVLLVLILSHFYAPSLFEYVRIAASIATPVAFVLLIIMFALNRWKPLRKDPDKITK